jgi:hypothetical protein
MEHEGSLPHSQVRAPLLENVTLNTTALMQYVPDRGTYQFFISVDRRNIFHVSQNIFK